MKKQNAKIPVATVENISPQEKSPYRVDKEFRRLLDSGVKLRADGQAKANPTSLLSKGYSPKYEILLFGTRYFLCNQRDAHGLKVIPGYVLQAPEWRRGPATIFARLFYKDSSLVWRVASHYVHTNDEHWIGKGAVRWVEKRSMRGWFSAEETTNLPFEMQSAMDNVSQRGPRKHNDNRILGLVVRNAPTDRVWPYQDFAAPRDKAMKVPANRINDNRPIAWFDDDYDPRSLKFAAGFQPDFKAIIDVSRSRSSMYGGNIRKFRIASRNGLVQYMFVAGTQHVWLVNPQAFTTELSSFGLRTVDAIADEDIFIPGYEFFDNEGTGEIDDQIPPGFAGPACPVDPDRADASPWNEKMPVVRSFRRLVLAS